MRVLKAQNFTFQSGSIQITQCQLATWTLTIFTFQSGSIQIFKTDTSFTFISSLHSNLVLFKLVAITMWKIHIKNLYIPIWFYSNRSKLNALYAFVTFTFQSGSIQM